MSPDVNTGYEFKKRSHKKAIDERAGLPLNWEAIAEQTRGICERVLAN
jgi:hypothetical protein